MILYGIRVELGCNRLKLSPVLHFAPGTSSIAHFFPLHDTASRDDLARVWFGWRVNPWQQPLDDVKEYLGEKIALYFAFTGHYTTWLVPLSVASVVIIIYYFILYCQSGTLMEVMDNGFLVPFFCIFVAIWAQLMLEYWKREVNMTCISIVYICSASNCTHAYEIRGFYFPIQTRARAIWGAQGPLFSPLPVVPW